MLRIRVFEQRVSDLYKSGEVPGFVHISIGQEATAVGACWPLRADDYIASTHRGHGHCLAKGMEMAPMLAELFGREGGACAGRGGSMHIADPGDRHARRQRHRWRRRADLRRRGVRRPVSW